MIPGGPTFGVTKRLQKWPRYFAHKDLQRGAETDASSIEVRDTAYRTQAATKRTVSLWGCMGSLTTGSPTGPLSTFGESGLNVQSGHSKDSQGPSCAPLGLGSLKR